MNEFKACRICLNIGVQMFDLQGFHKDFLEELLGHKILYSTDFPPYICYECAFLLKKFVKFKEKCLLGQNVLLEILQHNNQITKENILFVDRMKLKLASNLNISPVPAKSFYNFQDTADCDDVLDKFYKENKQIIKHEAGMSNDSAGILNDHTFLDEYDDNESLPEGEEKQDNQNILKEKDNHSLIQYEDFDDDYDFFVKATEDCVICRKKKDTSELSKVQKRGIETLKKFSLLRKDGLFSLFKSMKVIELHDKCRKKYIKCSKTNKYAPLKSADFVPKAKEPKPKKQDKPKKLKRRQKFKPFHLPSSQDRNIDYKSNCFICLNDVTQEARKPLDRRDHIYSVRGPTSKDTIMKYLSKIKNSSSPYPNIDETIERINELDLVNIGAVYHRSCYRMLSLEKRTAGSSGKLGRTVSKPMTEAMNLIYSYMEEMCDGTEFTLDELTGILPDYVPDNRTILRKLKDHFQDRIDVTKGPHNRSVILLKY